MTWTTEALATSKRLWGEGKSASEIADSLWFLHGVNKSRNAVIGVLHRAKVPKRTQQALANHVSKRQRADHQWRKPAPKRARITKEIAAMIQPIDPAPSLNVALGDLRENQCHAVTDATRWQQRYCGQPAVFGCSYCSGHFQRFRVITAKKGKEL